MRSSAAPAYCRLTVLAPGRRVDVALPADMPLAELAPLVLELLGEPGPAAALLPWRFTGATGGPLPPGATLDELGVLDGEMLRLGPAGPPPPQPVFDDPVDALAELAESGSPTPPPWRGAAAVAAALAAAGLLATTPTGTGGAVPWVAVAVGVLGSAVALALAARIARTPDGPTRARPDAPDGDDDVCDEGSATPQATGRAAALVPAYCAVPPAAAAAFVALPDGSGPAHLLLAAVAGGVAAALGRVAVRSAAPVLIATTVVAVLTATAATVGVRWDVAPSALGAVTAAAALSAGPLLPRVALWLAGLPRPVVPGDAASLVAADAGPDLLPTQELAERARTARDRLTGLSGGCAVVAGLAAPVAAVPGDPAGLALAAAVVAVLLLRARGFANPGPARAHLAVAITSGIGLIGLAAAAAGTVGRLSGALALLAAAVAFGRAPRTASPLVGHVLDIAEGVLAAAAVPLALGAAGLFGWVRGL